MEAIISALTNPWLMLGILGAVFLALLLITARLPAGDNDTLLGAVGERQVAQLRKNALREIKRQIVLAGAFWGVFMLVVAMVEVIRVPTALWIILAACSAAAIGLTLGTAVLNTLYMVARYRSARRRLRLDAQGEEQL